MSKYLLVIYFCIFALGVLEYVGNTYNISLIQNFFLTFVNRIATKTNEARVFVEAYSKFRISGIFQEPGAFAAFIFISCPIIYFLCTSKVRFLKIKVLDIFVKISTLVLMTLCFIGTQSPINLCFMLIFIGFIVIKKIINIKLKYKGIILSTLFCIAIVISIFTLNILSFQNIDITDTYLNRIVKVLETFTSMSKLVEAEPSLATRIGNYCAEFVICLKHPFFGIGYGNIMNEWPQTVLSLPFPITPELFLAASLKQTSAVSTMFWKLLAETGFPGTILFYILLFKIYFSANVAKKYYFEYENGLINSLQIALLLYIFVSYYIFLQPIMWVYFGILESMILNSNGFTIEKKVINDKKES